MKPIYLIIPVLLIAASGAIACSPAATPTRAPEIAGAAATHALAAPAAPGRMYPAPAMEQPAAQPTTLAAGAPESSSALNTSPGQSGQLAFAPVGSGMVIKDAEIHLLVENPDRAIAQTTQLIADNGGYIISTQTWFQDGYKYASLRLGVPSPVFEKTLNALRGLAVKVTAETASGQDVSSAYVDLQSRLSNLDATSARVRDFLKNARNVEESLKINQQLADLEAQMEQIKGQMRYYEGRSAYSTLTVYIDPQAPAPTPTAIPTQTPTPTPTPVWNPGSAYQQASGVLKTASQSLADMLIWLVVLFGPFILVGILILAIIRGLRRNHKTMPAPGVERRE